MELRARGVVVLFLVWLALVDAVFAMEDAPVTTLFSIEGQRLSIPSNTLGFAANIEVVLPSSYHDSPRRHYPVIYLLDSQWRLSTFMHSYGVLAYEKVLPESIIVGLNANLLNGPLRGDIDSFRRTYFSPPSLTELNSVSKEEGIQQAGHADKLLAFFQSDLIPYIDKHYRAQADRTLVGTSLSGLFGLYVLFHQPNDFQRYIISSPSVYWNNDMIFAIEERFAKARELVAAKLFISVGDEELREKITSFAQLLNKERHPKLQSRFHESPLGHVSADIEAIVRGLSFVFEDAQQSAK